MLLFSKTLNRDHIAEALRMQGDLIDKNNVEMPVFVNTKELYE